ncbi:MAG: hypothetical protein MUF64_02550 [Polyangiaceae bacterium]|nr:hypothetical protein [Polyangiaceae bacterium]
MVERDVAERVLRGHQQLKPSENSYDWLGRGIYFWEHGPARALQWAQAQAERDQIRAPAHRSPIETPAVVGAVIHLGECFDLLDRGNTQALAEWADRSQRALGESFPRNRGDTPELKLRIGDCAIINTYLDMRAQEGVIHDTVRGCFLEGGPIFEGSGISRLAHIQVAVRNPACIIGYFWPTVAGQP